MPGLTQAEFARRDGCTTSTVSRGVREGRLKLSDEGGIDPLQVGTQWRERTRRKGGGGRKKQKAVSTGVQHRGDDYALLLFRKEQHMTALRELEWKQKSGAAVSLEIVKRELFGLSRSARDAWMNWPASVAPILAHEIGIEPDVMMRLLSKHVQTHILALGDPQASFLHEARSD